MARLAFTALSLLILGMTFESCKRTGCKEDVLCVDNYDKKAKKAGDCSGCTTFGAANYCPEATQDNGLCIYIRKFYTDYGAEGWVDVWVADSANQSEFSALVYEGRIANFPKLIPECESPDSTLEVLRFPGEYYYEIETQTGQRAWGWVIYREEGCRLLDVY